MGVTGLLGFTSAASRPANASELRGETAAIDAYCWLHRGTFSCADKLAMDQPTDMHIKYCMKYVHMLLSHDIKPILVFDGRHLPAKLITEIKRRDSRSIAKYRAAELLRLGKFEEARTQMRRSVDVTHKMALELIKECRKINVDCIVAPYEADAQLAYLNRKGIAQVVITEDSDLLLFGCDKIFFKMDINGNGTIVESAKLPLVMKCPLERYNFDKFLQMCILSGCDYLPSLPGIGLAKARQFINSTRDPDISNAIKKIPSFFNKSNLKVTEEYIEGFVKAEATFKYQLVYDPIDRMMIPLNPSDGVDPERCSNAGELLDNKIAFQLALGNLDPFTLKTMDDWDPDNENCKPSGGQTNKWTQCVIARHKSIWHKDYLESMNKIKIKESFAPAITIPKTRPLKTKVMNTSISNESTSLSIEDLKSMYYNEPASKKSKFVPETQYPEYECADSSLLSPEKIESKINDEDTSPVLQKSNNTRRKLMKHGSFSKLKMLSKFQRTTIDENHVVQSRFFNAVLPETPPESSENCLVQNADISISDLGKLELDTSVEKTVIKESPIKVNVTSPSRNPFKKIESNGIEIIHDLSNQLTPRCSEDLSVIETEEIESQNIISDDDIKISEETKKPSPKLISKSVVRKSNSKRNSNGAISQQSLLTVFGFQKKCKLQH